MLEFRDIDVLVPVDFSRCSREALAAAVNLVRASGGRLTILKVGALPDVHPTDLSPVGPGGRSWADVHADVRAAEEGQLAALVAELVPPEIERRAIYREGRPAHQILETLRDHPYDLVVMGSHGKGTLERLFVGSVTQQVMRRSATPVLVVPPQAGGEPW